MHPNYFLKLFIPLIRTNNESEELIYYIHRICRVFITPLTVIIQFVWYLYW